jgi:hypothetical protein
MVQIYTHEGRKGTLLTQSDMDRIIKVGDKYFIPRAKLDCVALVEEEFKDLVSSGKTAKEIAKFYGKSVSWVNIQYYKIFGTASKKTISEFSK